MVVDTPLTEAEFDRTFHALADMTRRDILGRAIRSDESVSALSRHYSISLTAVQKHIAVLERAALVTKERRGREQIAHANRPTIASSPPPNPRSSPPRKSGPTRPPTPSSAKPPASP